MDQKILEACRQFSAGLEENNAYVMKMEEAKPKIESEENNLYLIDIRSESTYNAGHISGAANYPLAKLVDKADSIPKNRPVFVVCQTNYASAYATMALRLLGFDATLVLGGVPAWEDAGGTLVKS